ncbi:hypothetical protein [Hyalangium gracile]|uniref:hypothetical protein n=1 Tax=Hyalangium gracile TaxID=394092 RepID=UPI001CCD664F|nr:hypothetical protein [Hyalangium gracile]
MRVTHGSPGVLGLWRVCSTLVVLAACAPALEEEEDAMSVHREELVEIASIHPSRELFIHDVSVVDDALYTTWDPRRSGTDPEGAWSFGRLIDNMVPELLRNPYGRSQFILHWLKSWERDQTVNGLVIPARPLIRSQLIDPWRAASGCKGADDRCVLDLSKAPFRLLAIVNRPDLRRVPTATSPGNAGQGRFVFGVLGPDGERLPFTVIFEYQLPISRKVDMITWATRWHALGSIPFGRLYNAKLHSVTREFTRRHAAPGQVNGSALLQIRTNEAALSSAEPPLWELREFVLGSTGMLRPATVKQEVDAALNGSALLGAWAAQNAAAILEGRHVVPGSFQGQRFLAAAAPVPLDLAWQVPGVSEEVRHAFSLATCSGCHKSETGTFFLHVRTREAGAAAQLSAFLAEELSPTGPRVMDFHGLLNTADANTLKDGRGKEHPEHPSAEE